eukprot:jgi/Undpi1/5306/HiC_scaffold_2.g00587.m1
MNDVFDSMERDFMMNPSWGTAFRFPHVHPMLPSINPAASGVQDGRFGMHLDFHETENGFELTADLPGVRKDDITVDVDRESGVLTVSGERKSNREEKSEGGGDGEGGDRKYHFVERSYGKTTRSIRLPETADFSKANAEYTSGVLTLTFPKKEVAETARRIKIPIEDGTGDGKVSTTEGGGGKMTTDGDDV